MKLLCVMDVIRYFKNEELLNISIDSITEEESQSHYRNNFARIDCSLV
jgi:hypothetical protein